MHAEGDSAVAEEGEGKEGVKPEQAAPRRPRTFASDAPFNPENYAGIPGSPPVTDKGASTRQLRPRKLSHRLKYVAQLAAMGCTQKEICQRTGYTPHRMSVVLNTPEVSNEVERTRRFIFGKSSEQAMKTMMPQALENIHRTLHFETDNFKELKAKTDVSFTLIEHVHGKPKQQIDVGGSLLADLYHMLDQRTVEGLPPALEAESRRLEGDDAEILSSAIDPLKSEGGEPVNSPPPDEKEESMDDYLDAFLGPKESSGGGA